jgi:hypothetical protein
VTLILYHLKPKVVEKTSQVNRLFSARQTSLEELEKDYNKKCRDMINRLNKAEDLNDLKTATFSLAKDALIQAADVCHGKTTSIAKQAPLVAKHVAQSIENVVEETSSDISTYYQTGFFAMKDSLSTANNGEEIRLAIGGFCTVISQIFSGLAMSIKYEKNRCVTEIRHSLKESNQTQEEEFFDAEDNPSWAPGITI